jgi:hypothetical protein
VRGRVVKGRQRRQAWERQLILQGWNDDDVRFIKEQEWLFKGKGWQRVDGQQRAVKKRHGIDSVDSSDTVDSNEATGANDDDDDDANEAKDAKEAKAAL